MEAETIDHPQELKPKTIPAIQNPPAAQAALASQMIITTINITESHVRKEDGRNDSSPK